MSVDVDEAEHSLELQLPFIAQVMEGQEYSLVPIMVGLLSTEDEAMYGKALAPYLDAPGNMFVISSDFCHWGPRFRYTPYDRSKGEIWQSIEALDREGMDLIEEQDPEAYASYQKATDNTICGRHPIAVLLNALRHSKYAGKRVLQFTHYDQSDKCRKPSDNSVSYAAAVVTQDPKLME